ncbi:hypothetical protein GYMLUDRAFT_218846 [Collybiopsis luxurians FD-317 M1]|nr:hypothetical protein GYMLUDRAFT_218846 [Collybiopsis luxurians FD-317 M1]
MSRQDKTTTERHARTLRELVKIPENKICADCKRNDARWASWNIGVFVCIRCSGIHRSMGTHISKVKSVDLDVWTPEQMESIQKWGNRLANLYWEAHLKAGHIPPDHKIESFIRSKYESRRWALEGPPPSDPSVLANGVTTAPAPPSAPTTPVQQQTPVTNSSRASHAQTSSVSATRSPGSAASTRHQLLSAGLVNKPVGAASVATPQSQAAAATAPPAPAPALQNDLFTLDFHAPPTMNNNTSSNTSPEPKKDMKQDILSLFSAAPPQSAAVNPGFGNFAGVPSQAAASPWGAAPVSAAQAPVTSMMGSNGTGMWGTSSGWNAAPALPVQNVWGDQPTMVYPPQPQHPPQQQPNLFASSGNIWGNSSTTMAPAAPGASQDLFGSFSSATPAQKKQDDAFGDIWGGFK